MHSFPELHQLPPQRHLGPPHQKSKNSSQPSSNHLDPTRQPLTWPPTLHLIRPLSPHSSTALHPLHLIPLLINAFNIKPPHRHNQHNLHLQQRQLLPNTVPRPKFKRPPRPLDRVQRVSRSNEPALRQEGVGRGPKGRVALDSLGDRPDEAAGGGVEGAVISADGEVWLALTGGGSDREEAQGFFDDGEGIGELVDEVRRFREEGRSGGEVRCKEGVVFSAEEGEGGRVLGEEVKEVADGGASGVVAGEEKEFDLAGEEGFVGWVNGLGRVFGVGLEIGF